MTTKAVEEQLGLLKEFPGEAELLRLATLKMRVSEDLLLQMLREPKWGNYVRLVSWRNHVPQLIQDIWDDLPLATRLAIATVAAYETDNHYGDY